MRYNFHMNYTDSSSWHPAANLFPLIVGSDFEQLVTSVRDNGLQNPVVLYENKVLDGRNRLRACAEAGIAPSFTEWAPNGLGPTEWVLAQNLHRRNLDAGQKACIAVDAKPLLEADAKARMLAGVKIEPSVKNDSGLTERALQVRAQVAQQTGVSEGYVHAAQKIKDASPETFEQVKAGTLSIPEAQRQLGMKKTVAALGMSESNEWYTPSDYIEAARRVMGSIDLDPASNDMANERVVKADEYFTIDDDGLQQPWAGNVWLNPPYADIGPKFAAKLIEEYRAGNVTQAILLVNPRTDTAWFQPLFDYMLCFSDHRLKFWKPNGMGESPTTGSVFIYLGENKAEFAKEFGVFGAVVTRYKGGAK